MHSNEKRQRVLNAISKLPRVTLTNLPTPLQPATRLTTTLHGPEILIKRDDLTSLAMGGNKTRMLEFSLGYALRDNADSVGAVSVVQSNYCRQLAAACAQLGLPCFLVLYKLRGTRDLSIQGNLLLDLLAGAKVEIRDGDFGGINLAEERKRLAEQIGGAGKKVFVARDSMRSLAYEAVSYVNCMIEMCDQLDALGKTANRIYCSSGLTTQAGLVVGKKALGCECEIVGINAEHWFSNPAARMAEVAQEAADLLGIQTTITEKDICNTKAFVGEGYGIPTEADLQAIRLLAKTEGIFLDPVYTGKAMAALLCDVAKNVTGSGETVVFLHTGGGPVLFAYSEEFAENVHEERQFSDGMDERKIIKMTM